MNTRYDQLAKQLLRAGLESRGTFTAELEVSHDPQQVDGYFVPDLQRPSPVANTLLGQMTQSTCSFEVFSSPADVLEVLECLRKHLNLCHLLRKNETAPSLPHLWILCAGKPESALEGVGAGAVVDVMAGIYELPSAFATSIIVLSELPELRSTLLLRLMARGRTLKRAIAELKSLSDVEFERCIALPLLIRYRFEAETAPVSQVDEEFLMNAQEAMDLFERRARLQGEEQGALKGHRAAVLRQLRRKFGELPEDVVSRVQNADVPLLEKLEDNVLFAQSLEEVFAP